jgi:hypothetical protein
MPFVANAVRFRGALGDSDCEHMQAVSHRDCRGLKWQAILDTVTPSLMRIRRYSDARNLI